MCGWVCCSFSDDGGGITRTVKVLSRSLFQRRLSVVRRLCRRRSPEDARGPSGPSLARPYVIVGQHRATSNFVRPACSYRRPSSTRLAGTGKRWCRYFGMHEVYVREGWTPRGRRGATCGLLMARLTTHKDLVSRGEPRYVPTDHVRNSEAIALGRPCHCKIALPSWTQENVSWHPCVLHRRWSEAM
jgi:hypothetical protein